MQPPHTSRPQVSPLTPNWWPLAQAEGQEGERFAVDGPFLDELSGSSRAGRARRAQLGDRNEGRTAGDTDEVARSSGRRGPQPGFAVGCGVSWGGASGSVPRFPVSRRGWRCQAGCSQRGPPHRAQMPPRALSPRLMPICDVWGGQSLAPAGLTDESGSKQSKVRAGQTGGKRRHRSLGVGPGRSGRAEPVGRAISSLGPDGAGDSPTPGPWGCSVARRTEGQRLVPGRRALPQTCPLAVVPLASRGRLPWRSGLVLRTSWARDRPAAVPQPHGSRLCHLVPLAHRQTPQV